MPIVAKIYRSLTLVGDMTLCRFGRKSTDNSKSLPSPTSRASPPSHSIHIPTLNFLYLPMMARMYTRATQLLIYTTVCLLLLDFAAGFVSQSSPMKTRTSTQVPSSSPAAFSQLHPGKPTIMGALFSNPKQLSEQVKSQYSNKSILITGASRGLGRALAIALSECHPSLLILSGRDVAALEEVKNECLKIQQSSPNTSIECIPCDLADKSSVQSLANHSLSLKTPIDILINNGGISSRSSFIDTQLEIDERVMQINFFSGVALAKAVVPGMVENGAGKIVWISSVQGKREFDYYYYTINILWMHGMISMLLHTHTVGTPYRTSYAASKFAVQGYCEALRSELAPDNISVHVCSPGYIKTNLSMSAVMGDGKAYSKMDETTANGKL